MMRLNKPKMAAVDKPTNKRKDTDHDDKEKHKKNEKLETNKISSKEIISRSQTEDICQDTYNWTDENTYLSPKISLLAPSPILMERLSEFPSKPFLQVSFQPALIEIKVFIPCTFFIHFIHIWLGYILMGFTGCNTNPCSNIHLCNGGHLLI